MKLQMKEAVDNNNDQLLQQVYETHSIFQYLIQEITWQ